MVTSRVNPPQLGQIETPGYGATHRFFSDPIPSKKSGGTLVRSFWLKFLRDNVISKAKDLEKIQGTAKCLII